MVNSYLVNSLELDNSSYMTQVYCGSTIVVKALFVNVTDSVRFSSAVKEGTVEALVHGEPQVAVLLPSTPPPSSALDRAVIIDEEMTTTAISGSATSTQSSNLATSIAAALTAVILLIVILVIIRLRRGRDHGSKRLEDGGSHGQIALRAEAKSRKPTSPYDQATRRLDWDNQWEFDSGTNAKKRLAGADKSKTTKDQRQRAIMRQNVELSGVATWVPQPPQPTSYLTLRQSSGSETGYCPPATIGGTTTGLVRKATVFDDDDVIDTQERTFSNVVRFATDDGDDSFFTSEAKMAAEPKSPLEVMFDGLDDASTIDGASAVGDLYSMLDLNEFAALDGSNTEL